MLALLDILSVIFNATALCTLVQRGNFNDPCQVTSMEHIPDMFTVVFIAFIYHV